MQAPLPLGEVYQLIEPGPVVLLSTRNRAGEANIMTLSWHMMMAFNPPLIAVLVSSADHSHTALSETGDCVIGIPSVDELDLVIALGNSSGRDIDKIATFDVAIQPASRVRAPLIVPCMANLECQVLDRTLVPRFDLFVLEVVAAWRTPGREAVPMLHHRGHGVFAVDGEIRKTASGMP